MSTPTLYLFKVSFLMASYNIVATDAITAINAVLERCLEKSRTQRYQPHEVLGVKQECSIEMVVPPAAKSSGEPYR